MKIHEAERSESVQARQSAMIGGLLHMWGKFAKTPRPVMGGCGTERDGVYGKWTKDGGRMIKKYKRKVQQLTVGVQSYIMIKINAWI